METVQAFGADFGFSVLSEHVLDPSWSWKDPEAPQMRNIALTKASCTTNIEDDLLRGCELFVEDNATDCVYLVNQENVVVLSSDLKICSSCFLGEACPAASWSPDQAVLVAVDEDRIVFYGRDFGVIAEWKMTNQDAGKDALVTVGWGAAETQFQGSAGKAAREKRVEVIRTALPTDTHKPYIKWRADSQFVAVSFFEELSGERRVAVGILIHFPDYRTFLNFGCITGRPALHNITHIISFL
ncbi:unnamed protein product [Heligmosomoides polygyrus]|uniref:TFIIIC_delta domain-containing protein n=1 Tax=Heligmosomoides polygyrus TaxID=6339 RepID=A0A183GSC8_HELPZ|nr:unnamed protein product [Heligmosomoides polygyrus]